MNKLIGMLLLISVFANAEGPVLVSYEFAQDWGKGASPSTVKKFDVGVDEGGVAEIKVYRLDTFRGSSTLVNTKTKDISGDKGFTQLKSKLRPLYTGQVNTTRRLRRCFKMPKPWEKIDELSVRVGTSDELRSVLAGENCWSLMHTVPDDEDAAKNAREVRGMMIKIAKSFRF